MLLVKASSSATVPEGKSGKQRLTFKSPLPPAPPHHEGSVVSGEPIPGLRRRRKPATSGSFLFWMILILGSALAISACFMALDLSGKDFLLRGPSRTFFAPPGVSMAPAHRNVDSGGGTSGAPRERDHVDVAATAAALREGDAGGVALDPDTPVSALLAQTGSGAGPSAASEQQAPLPPRGEPSTAATASALAAAQQPPPTAPRREGAVAASSATATAATTTAAVAAAEVAAAAPLLVIGIPSVRREGDPDYVARTLRFITEQLAGGGGPGGVGGAAPGPHPLAVRVLVMSNTREPAQGGGAAPHAAFLAARDAFCGGTGCAEGRVLGHRVWSAGAAGGAGGLAASTLLFVQNGQPAVADGEDPGTDNVPGARVRRQTRDVADMLAVVYEVWGQQEGQGAAPAASLPRYFMFMEDDFRLCPRGVEALAYMTALASAASGPLPWNALRCSFGLNGAIVRLADLPALRAYYLEHLARRPPDHLTVEWFAGETAQSAATKAGRPHVAFRYNVLEHFGHTSSLRGLPAPLFAYCYDALSEAVVFEVEAFRRTACAHTDVSPCAGLDPATAPRTNIDFAALAAGARADTVQQWQPPPPR